MYPLHLNVKLHTHTNVIFPQLLLLYTVIVESPKFGRIKLGIPDKAIDLHELKKFHLSFALHNY